MCFDSCQDAFLYFMGYGGIYDGFLAGYDKYLSVDVIRRIWESHGCLRLSCTEVCILLRFKNTVEWDGLSVEEVMLGFEDVASKFADDWSWRSCLGVEGLCKNVDTRADAFLADLSWDYVLTGVIPAGLFSVLYGLGAVTVLNSSYIKFRVVMERGGSQSMSSWYYRESEGVYGLVGLVDRSWLEDALYNNTVSGGIYRYLWGKGR